MSIGAPLIILAAVGVYGLLHSFLAALGTKESTRHWFGPTADRWYRLVYNLVAVITLLPVLALPALLPDRQLYVIPAPWIYLTGALQLLALAALGVGLLQTGALHFLGLEQVFKKPSVEQRRMVTGGMYRWVRHPLYTAGLVLIWFIPVMTVNLFALNAGLTIYLITGTIFEERKLVREFGDEYLEYREQIPMLVPFPWKKR